MAGTADTKIAFVDESRRDDADGGIYIVAAAIVASSDQSRLERSLRGARASRRRRVHWHAEDEKTRLRLLDLIAEQPLTGVTVAVRAATARRQEKAREVALWNLVTALASHDVGEMVFEARQERLNRRDRRTMVSIQRAGLGPGLRYRFARPHEEPLLWMPDVLAGAFGPWLVMGDDSYVVRLPADLVAVHEVCL